MVKIAGVTVLYRPDKIVVQNILSYLDQVDKLYVVDNSEDIAPCIGEELNKYKKIEYLKVFKNIGIAAALNRGAYKSIEDGFDFLLTMDQDSKASKNLIKEMAIELEKDCQIGILAPRIIQVQNPQISESKRLEEVITCITSGSIVRLSVFKKIGGFEEKLFIDYVDHEYCLRMKLFGYKILQLNSVFIYHNLGNIVLRKFFSKKVFPTNHSSLRWYYRTRNRFYIFEKYKDNFPEYVKNDKIAFLKEILKILFYEDKTIEKYKMIIRGYIDYRRNKFGKLNY
ncbi:MAG: glycosyltransferase family 2 protein [Ignavibacteriaceae bacterium]|nr:glycosyltransferase family 2 protein [Ignavibacteriaceae bacterium]